MIDPHNSQVPKKIRCKLAVVVDPMQNETPLELRLNSLMENNAIASVPILLRIAVGFCIIVIRSLVGGEEGQ